MVKEDLVGLVGGAEAEEVVLVPLGLVHGEAGLALLPAGAPPLALVGAQSFVLHNVRKPAGFQRVDINRFIALVVERRWTASGSLRCPRSDRRSAAIRPGFIIVPPEETAERATFWLSCRWRRAGARERYRCISGSGRWLQSVCALGRSQRESCSKRHLLSVSDLT